MMSAPSQRAWRINENNTLFWNEQAYMPVGLRIEGTTQAIEEARAAGVKDVIIDLPADGTGWKQTLLALDQAGMRYMIAISSLAPTCTGVAVEPQGYRVPGIAAPRHIDLNIPAASAGLVALVTQRDSSVQMTQRVKMPGGLLSIDVDPKNELEHVLLVYPIVNELKVPDYWAGFDARRDELIGALRNNKPGVGFRGIVNPMGRLLSFPSLDTQFVPTHPIFQLELEAFLRQKYTSIQTAIRSWALATNNIENFGQLSKLVPLWSATRGVTLLWNPDSEEVVGCESKRSTAWKDIQEVLRATSARRYARFVQAIQKVVDVPVLQEYAGWSGPYSGQESALTGVGMTMEGGSPASLIESGCRAASTVLRWRQPGWLVVTSLDITTDNQAEGLLADTLSDASSMGARGWFVRARSDAMRKAVATSTLGADASLATWRTTALFYPESAMNPAAPTRLPGGRWWLPSPGGGNRVDLGPNYAAYRYTDGIENFVAMWSIGVPRKTAVRLADPKKAVFETIDNSQTGAKIVKNTVELTIPTTPIILRGSDEIPIPQDAIDTTSLELVALLERAGNRPGAGEESYRMKENLNALDRNPGGAFDALRLQINKLNVAVSAYVWIEGETSRETNFSEPLAVPGTSKNAVLSLRSRLASPPEGYFATYNPVIRVEGQHEIWVAARIPPKARDTFFLRIGDQVMKIERGPVSLYANGYGWYRMGEVSLVKGPIQMQIAVDSKDGADLAIDVVLVSPERFNPNGVYPPRG